MKPTTRLTARLCGPVVGLLLSAAGSATAATLDGAVIAAQGNGAGAAACATCHGAHGEGNSAGFPRLAGLPATYLEQQLEAFASGKRNNPVMMPMAKALTPEQRKAVARYYSGLPAPKTPISTAKPDPAGEALAKRGDWARNVPGCERCHGPGGVGVGAAFPPLAGQPSAYIATQLHAWQQDQRPSGPLGLMPAIAKRLSDKEIQAVSDYFATLPPTGTEGNP